MSYKDKDLSDEETVELIMESLEGDGNIRMEYIEVECFQGRPVISGRVGSEEELHVIDEIMTDALEFSDYENNVWVDDTLALESVDENQAENGSSLKEEEDDDELDADETFEPDDEEGDK